jgi:2-phosphosulfolactate phosphatase
MTEVSVHLLPALFEPEQLRGGVAVVIDVLRASTTIIHALAAGATAVLPCGDVDEAHQLAKSLPTGQALLGGERGGTRIAGFDLGNSPFEYTSERIAGKTVVFTTTNGTRALLRAQQAERVLIGAFVNLRALVRVLLEDGSPVHLVCAGTDGGVTTEDVLFAGAAAHSLWQHTGQPAQLDDETRLALSLFESRTHNPAEVLETLRESRGGRNLVELGFDADIERASTWDLFEVVPELHRDPWRLLPTTTT